VTGCAGPTPALAHLHRFLQTATPTGDVALVESHSQVVEAVNTQMYNYHQENVFICNVLHLIVYILCVQKEEAHNG